MTQSLLFDGNSSSGLGFRPSIDALLCEVADLYQADSIPWIVGYSGGKDSTTTLQLVWRALQRMRPEERHKPVHVISTDTLVENPVVVRWAEGSLAAMRRAAAEQGLPIQVHRLTPALDDSFWVLLIGRGYPAPRNKFRWCTDRLKIKPSNAFIRSVISANGEAILLLGTRKAESAGRAARMDRLEAKRVRERLSPNASLPGSLVYSPIEAWSNDDVWVFLMQDKNPWGWDNKSLLTLYQGASEGGECPLVVDTSTPSCGSSRFGCWVCTLVEQDKSMAAMIHNDADKEWLLPLLDLRNALDFRNGEDGDRPLRDYRRMNGRVQLMSAGTRVIPGPYTQTARAGWLRRLLEAERAVRRMGPDEVSDVEMVTMAELHEIRRIWVEEKYELEDLLPRIYQEVRGEQFPSVPLGVPGIDSEYLDALREVCGGDEHLYAMSRDLLAVEHRYHRMERRAGLFGALGAVMDRYAFRSEAEALAVRREVDAQIDMFDSEVPAPASREDPRGFAVAHAQKLVEVGGVAGELARQLAEDLPEAILGDY